jgi:hypothetical protein
LSRVSARAGVSSGSCGSSLSRFSTGTAHAYSAIAGVVDAGIHGFASFATDASVRRRIRAGFAEFNADIARIATADLIEESLGVEGAAGTQGNNHYHRRPQKGACLYHFHDFPPRFPPFSPAWVQKEPVFRRSI